MTTEQPTSTDNSSETQSTVQPPKDHPSDPVQLPQPPPDKYDSYPKIIITQAPLHPGPSNQKLIKFLFSLSNLILFGGSIAGIIVYIYQKYIYNKLKKRTEILRLLRLSTLKSYQVLCGNLKDLIQSNSTLYPSSIRKICSKDANEIYAKDSPINERVEKSELDTNQNVHANSTGSANSALTDGKDPSQLVNDVMSDEASKNMHSDSVSSRSTRSDHDTNEVETSNQGKLNQVIIQHLRKIAKGLKKRSEISTESLDLNPSEDIMNTNLSEKTNSIGIKKLRQSIKSMEEELAYQTEQMTFINQRLSSSYHHTTYAFNQWNTYSSSPASLSIDNDNYFIALNQFKSQIRDLKGSLLNRKKFY